MHGSRPRAFSTSSCLVLYVGFLLAMMGGPALITLAIHCDFAFAMLTVEKGVLDRP